jgi:hypothetical protein
MRRTAVYLAILGLASMAMPAAAAALPTVKFKALALPIPGFAQTGDILGAGSDLQTEYAIEGSEYAGGPPPIIGVNFYLPNGTTLHPSGFPTCSPSVLERFGPIRCPKGSAAGPVGQVLGFVTFGDQRVEEAVELSSFYAPGGGIEFFADGHSPVSIEVLSKGHYVRLNGAEGFGWKVEVEVPLVATVPGAPYASVRTIIGKFGSAYIAHGRTIYYGRVPKTCPQGGFPLKTEVTFAENGEPARPRTVTVQYTAPCPRK